jgi:hypothetical protein
VVEEENIEDEGGENYKLRRQSRFKLVKDKNEFNKTKRNRSTEIFTEKEDLDAKISYFNNLCGDVSEDDEEEASDSSEEKQQKM